MAKLKIRFGGIAKKSKTEIVLVLVFLGVLGGLGGSISFLRRMPSSQQQSTR
jgi:hypothetical protein